MFGILLAALVAFTAEDAKIAYDAADAFVRDCTPRDAGTVRGRLAANWILDRVSRCGVDAETDVFRAPSPRGEKSFANVTVTFRSEREDAPWIVLISHFDTAPGIVPLEKPTGNGKARLFQGANDGASTTGLLIALAGCLRRAGRPNANVMLAWTDAEEAVVTYGPEDGFQGAKRLMETFRAQKRRVGAVIGLDMLGDRDLGITIPANGTPALRAAVHAAAKTAGVAAIVRDGKDNVKDDFSVFLDAGCPAVDLIDFEYGSSPGANDYWHTMQDSMDKVSEKSLHLAGKLVAETLNRIDARQAEK